MEPQVYGTFTFPVHDDEPHSDPTSRPYMVAPKFKAYVQRTYPLVDVRGKVLSGHADAADTSSPAASFLSEWGFTAIRRPSALFTTPCAEQESIVSVERMDSIYYPEVRDLVQKLTGCKQVYIMNSIRRGPGLNVHEATREELQKEEAQLGGHNRSRELSLVDSKDIDTTQPIHRAVPAPPVRTPHIDYTPLGARRAIRCLRPDVHSAALDSGVIATEDKICAGRGFTPMDSASDELMAARFNKDAPGPRYAIFSVWRPLQTVTRDPLALTPPTRLHHDKHLSLSAFEVRKPGFQGDFQQQFVMVEARSADAAHACSNDLEWYYVSEMRKDEVLVIKLFDSAALDENASEAPGVPHASPDIGEAGCGSPRESVEVRAIAFW